MQLFTNVYFTREQIAQWFIGAHKGKDLTYEEETLIIRSFLENTSDQKILATSEDYIEGILDIVYNDISKPRFDGLL